MTRNDLGGNIFREVCRRTVCLLAFGLGWVGAVALAESAPEAAIQVDASRGLHSVSPYLTGACLEDVNHEIYGGLYSQMVFGESFQEPAPAQQLAGFTKYGGTHWLGGVSGMWDAIQIGTIAGQCSLENSNPFVGTQSQRITVTGGAGKLGVANHSLNRWGMNLVAGKVYEGCLDVRADSPIQLTVALESGDGAKTYATQDLLVTSNRWQRLDFTLIPSASDTNGRLALTLGQPGSVVLGYVYLEPGDWGRFHGLPVRQDVVAGLTNQGVTVLRFGGSMVNAAGYRWKNMVGPRDHRPPYTGTWYAYSTDGWGVPDFLNLCEAAGFLGVPDFNINESPQDMADFIDYVNGSINTVWGAQRLADGHAAPYGLKYLELGNEERVDDTYFQKFKPLEEAIWAKDTNIVIVVGDFQYSQVITNPFSFGGADSHITSLAAQQEILQLAGQHHCEVWFDLHVWDDGPKPTSTLDAMFSYYDALDKLANGARHRVVVFELNANNHSQRRALANALAINAIERDGRLPITTSANCLQPDGQNDNGWDQGLLFLNPSQVWSEPPGYVCQMKQVGYQPLEVQCTTVGDTNLDASAKMSVDGRTLTVQVVNLNASPTKAGIQFNGFSPTAPAVVEQLADALEADNTAVHPKRITPVQTQVAAANANGLTECTLPPFSFTVMTFQGQR